MVYLLLIRKAANPSNSNSRNPASNKQKAVRVTGHRWMIS